VDGIMASVGTCNLDVRSFELDYEINAMFYDSQMAAEIKAQFHKDMADCREITLKDLKTTSVLYQLRNSILRVFSPLL
jgi:cardiolipin synthase